MQTKFIIATILTVLSGLIVLWHSYEPPLENKKFFDFPMKIGEWTGEDVPMSDYVYQGIETKYLFLRNYRSGKYSQQVNLSIVWFDDRNLAFHTPEYCLGGVGINVARKGTEKIKINGREYEIGKMTVEFNNRNELVLYYFDVDGRITTSMTMIRVYTLLRRLTFRRASASFVRLMAPVEYGEQQTMDELIDFLDVITHEIPLFTYTDSIIKGTINNHP
jgi:EpsI family protein